jgi:phosphate butyryltransferase
MTIRHLTEIVTQAREFGTTTFAVAAPEDESVLRALEQARAMGIARAILIGNRRRILSICEAEGLTLHQGETIVDIPGAAESARAAARLVGDGEARCLMKGLVGTVDFLRGVLARDSKLRTGQLLSHVALVESPLLDRLLLSTDGAVTISPSFEEKIALIRNMLEVTRVLGLERPKIAVLAAIEKVYDNIVATKDAGKLVAMGREGAFDEAVVDGPLGVDGALSLRAAEQKGILSEVAGRADGLICPDLESANAVVKAAIYLGGVKNAGVVVGARSPIVLTSRSDTAETKLTSIALACLMAHWSRGD